MRQSDEVAPALLEALSAETGHKTSFRVAPHRIGGGFWAQIYGFELDHAPATFVGPLVLRVMPDAVAGRRETIVQRWLADTGYRTPSVLASGTAPGLGAAFMVMPLAEGRSPLTGLRLGPALFRLRPILKTLPAILVDAALQLHECEPAGLRVLLDDAGVEASELGAAPYLAALEGATSNQSSGFDLLRSWFDDHRPTPANAVVCHGDLHPFNLLIDDTGAVTVLDWTSATLAPREMDIGFTSGLLRCAPIGVPGPLRPIIARITTHLATSFIDSYRNTTEIDAHAVEWWEALQHARCLADLAHGRLTPGSVVGPFHPFETSARAMTDRTRRLTSIAVVLPERVTIGM